MNDFKKIKKDFIDDSLCYRSWLYLKYTSPELSLGLKASKYPSPNICTSIRFNYENLHLQAKALTGQKYIYGFTYNVPAIPITFNGKFKVEHLTLETCIQNQVGFEYKHKLLNLIVKLLDNPMNIFIKTTFGDQHIGVHASIKSDLRLKEMCKCITGLYYLNDNISVLLKYNHLKKDLSLWYKQNVSFNTFIIQSLSLSPKFGMQALQIGVLHKYSETVAVKGKADKEGKIIVSWSRDFTKALRLQLNFLTDLNKFTKNSLEYAFAMKLEINF